MIAISTITSAGIDAMYGRAHGEKDASAEFYGELTTILTIRGTLLTHKG